MTELKECAEVEAGAEGAIKSQTDGTAALMGRRQRGKHDRKKASYVSNHK